MLLGGCAPGMQQVASGVAAEVEAAGKRARVGVVCEGLFFQINGSGRRRWQREVKMAAGGADGSGRCRWDGRPNGNPKPAIKHSAAHLRSG